MASAACWALLLTVCSTTNAQSVNSTSVDQLQTTGNILNLGSSLPWNNTVTGAAGGYSGGWIPAYNPSTGNIIFGYTTQTVSQSVDINKALANSGSGIQLAGYIYNWGINNDLQNAGGNRGTLTGNVSLVSPSGSTLESFNYNYSQTNTGGSFQTFSGTQLFNNQYDVSAAEAITVSFTGKDQNFWAGYYGPRVHVNDFELLYKTNPCATNPAYSPTCPGFSSLLTSDNLVPKPNAIATVGNTVDNSFAISTALSNSGSGLSLYGINFGYTYNLPTSASSGSVTVGINPYGKTNSSGMTYNLNGPTQGAQIASYQLLTPSAINTNTFGDFTFQASVLGSGSIYNMNASLIVLPDTCTLNPLSSTTCTGYAKAYAAQQQKQAQDVVSSTIASIIASQTSSAVAAALSTTTAGTPTQDSSTAAQQTNPTQQTNNSTNGGAQQVAAGPQPDTSQQTQQQQPQQQQQAQNGAPAPPAPVASAAPSATNPQPKPGDVQMAGSTKPTGPGENKSSGPSALAMSVVSKEQAKVNAVTAAVVSQANDAAATATSQALTTAQTVAGTSQAASISASVAIATTNTSTTSKTTSNSNSTSVIMLQSNVQTNVVASNNQRMMANENNTNTVTTTTQSSGSLRPVRNDNSTNSQVVSASTQQSSSQTLPAPSKQQDNAQFETQQVQASVTLPTAPKQQEFVQTNVQQVATVSSTPTPPKQIDTSIQTQVVVASLVQQQTYQPVQVQPSVVQYVPPPQPVNNQTSSFVDYSITVKTNLDNIKKTNTFALTEEETPKIEYMKAGAKTTLSDYMNNQTFLALQGAEQTQDGMIKRNVQPNEVAGSVDISSIATQPKGYDAYSKVTLLDAKFYDSKEIYKNQDVVDNRRALRALGSDAKWQQMVDKQYK